MPTERETASWRRSIVDSQKRILFRVDDSPSLRPLLDQELRDIYTSAVRGAVFEIGVKAPGLLEGCPFSLDQLLDRYDLDWPG